MSVLLLDISGPRGAFPADLEDRLATAGQSGAEALVLVGGPNWFSSGSAPETLASVDLSAPYFERLPRALLSLPMPVVAACAGHAIGGGWALAQWCTAAVLSEDGLYGFDFARLGIPGVMGASLWPGPAQIGLRTGHVLRDNHTVVPGPDVEDAATDLAAALAQAPPRARRLLLGVLNRRRRARLVAAQRAEHAALLRCRPGLS